MAGVGEGPYIPHYFGREVTERLRQPTGWLTAAVHQTIGWPKETVLVEYDGREYYLLGTEDKESDRRFDPNIVVPLPDAKGVNETLHDAYVFGSILGWFFNGFVDVVGHITGARPTRYGSIRQPFPGTGLWGSESFDCNFMPLVRGDNARKALAFWREGQRLEQVHPAYAFLSYYKVVESQFQKGKHRGQWIDGALGSLPLEADKRIQELQTSQVDVGNHLFESGRCAVAHASIGRQLVDPDIPEDRIRISKDLVIVKCLAEKYIREEHRIPDRRDVLQGRDALGALYEYISQDHLEILRSGSSVPRRQLGINGLEISVRHWPSQTALVSNLKIKVSSAHNGVVKVLAESSLGSLSIGFVMDYKNAKIGPEIEVQ